MRITRKDLIKLVENFLIEQEKKEKEKTKKEELRFTLTLSRENLPPIDINFATETNEEGDYFLPKINSKDPKLDQHFTKGDEIDRLLIAIEKLKQLIETGENKKLAADIANFIKNFDKSIDSSLSTPEEVLAATKKHERYLKLAIDKIRKIFKRDNNNNLLS